MSSIDRIIEAARHIVLEVNPSDEFVALNRKRLKEALKTYDDENNALAEYQAKGGSTSRDYCCMCAGMCGRR